MNIEDLTIKEAREIAQLLGHATPVTPRTHSMRVGMQVLIRGVTYHYLGRVAAITDCDIVLADAAWLASSGRWHTALTTGVVSAVEPYPDDVACVVNRDIITDWCEWAHDLPRVVI